MKKNVLLVLFLLIVFAGCASVSTKFPAETKFSIENLKVNLTQKIQVDGYPAQAEFLEIVKEKLDASLKSKSLLADKDAKNAVSISIDIDYQRRFAGEDTPVPSKSVMAPVFGYTLVASENGVEKNRIVKSELTTKKGFLGNLKTAATLGLGNNAKDELEDIQKLTDSIANELSALKK